VPAIIYDFRAIGGALRKQRIDDWWQPAKPEPKAAEPVQPFLRSGWCDVDAFGGVSKNAALTKKTEGGCSR
jgi:hypothetical protein